VEPARPAAKNGLPGNGVGFSSSVERGLCTSVCAGACGDSAVVGRDPLSALCYTSMGPAHYYFLLWSIIKSEMCFTCTSLQVACERAE
jgi:hypothetical protein